MLRNRSDEEVLEEMKAVQGMWEMASVLEYLHLFRPQLNLRCGLSIYAKYLYV